MKNILIFLGIPLTVVGLFAHFGVKTQGAAAKLGTRISSIKNLKVVGGIFGVLQFDVDIQGDNPSTTALETQIRTAKISKDGTELGRSKANNLKYSIPPLSNGKFAELRFEIPIANLRKFITLPDSFTLNPMAFVPTGLKMEVDLNVNGFDATDKFNLT